MSPLPSARSVELNLARTCLYAFLWKAFEVLHPGETFIPTWHVEALCHALEEMAHGRCPRLVITVPPRHLKSVTTSVAYAAWVLGRDPSRKILVASYGSELALKHARDFRALVESSFYKEAFPRMQIERVTDGEITTTLRGSRKAVSVGGPMTGFGANLIIIDDPMKAADAQSPAERERVRTYYEQTLYSRLEDKARDQIVLVQQRLHEDDLAGYLIARGNIHHLNLPAVAARDESVPILWGRSHRRLQGEALFPQRESLAVLEQTRQEIGSFAFSSQYLQEPIPPGGSMLRWDQFGTYDPPMTRYDVQFCVQSWDTAFSSEPTSDFSVGTTWGYREGKWLLLDLVRARWDYPDLKARVIFEQKRWHADLVLIEAAGAGLSLVRELLRGELGARVQGPKPKQSKEVRVATQTDKLARGLVLLPRTAPWLEAFRHECVGFPSARHDDQVDSLVQFLEWAGSREAESRMDRWANGGRPSGRRRPTSLRAVHGSALG